MYETIATLNRFRNFLVSDISQHNWLAQNSTVVSYDDTDLIINKGGVILALNTLGSPVSINTVYREVRD